MSLIYLYQSITQAQSSVHSETFDGHDITEGLVLYKQNDGGKNAEVATNFSTNTLNLNDTLQCDTLAFKPCIFYSFN